MPSSADAEKVGRARKPSPDLGRNARPKGGTFGKRFLAVPPLNVNMNATMNAMDVRKWSWPGYLTFGGSKDEQSSEEGVKSDGASVDPAPVSGVTEKDEKDNAPGPSTVSSVSSASLHSRAASVSDVPVDSQALQDAFSNMQSGSSTPQTRPATPDATPTDKPIPSAVVQGQDAVESLGIPTEVQETMHSMPDQNSVSQVAANEPLASGDDDDAPEHTDNTTNEQATVNKASLPSGPGDSTADGNDPASMETPLNVLPSFNIAHAYLQPNDSPELKRSRILYLCVRSSSSTLFPIESHTKHIAA